MFDDVQPYHHPYAVANGDLHLLQEDWGSREDWVPREAFVFRPEDRQPEADDCTAGRCEGFHFHTTDQDQDCKLCVRLQKGNARWVPMCMKRPYTVPRRCTPAPAPEIWTETCLIGHPSKKNGERFS